MDIITALRQATGPNSIDLTAYSSTKKIAFAVLVIGFVVAIGCLIWWKKRSKEHIKIPLPGPTNNPTKPPPNPEQVLKAVKEADLLMLLELIEHPNVDFNFCNEHGTPLICFALQQIKFFDKNSAVDPTLGAEEDWFRNPQNVASILIYDDRCAKDCRDSQMRTPLHLAAMYEPSMIKDLLSQPGCDVNAIDSYGQTALHHLAKNENTTGELIDELIEHGADINIKDKLSATPVSLALQQKNDSAIKAFSKHKPELSNEEGFEMVTKHYVDDEDAICRSNDKIRVLTTVAKEYPQAVVAAVNEELKPGGVINLNIIPNYNDPTETSDELVKELSSDVPLIDAVRRGYYEDVITICEGKDAIDYTQKDSNGYSLLENARDPNIIRYLIKKGKNKGLDPYMIVKSGQTLLLHEAVSYGHHERVSVFVECIEDVNKKDKNKRTPLHFAAKGPSNEVMRILLGREDIQVNVSGFLGSTPLHCAVECGRNNHIKALCQKGADLSARDACQNTPFRLALKFRKDTCARTLLEQENYHVSISDLFEVAKFGRWKVIDKVLENLPQGETIDTEDPSTGFTALHFAAKEGHLETVKYLIDKDAKKNFVAKNFWTPIFTAAYYRVGNKKVQDVYEYLIGRDDIELGVGGIVDGKYISLDEFIAKQLKLNP